MTPSDPFAGRAMAAAQPTPKNILRGHRAQVHVATFIRGNERLVIGDADGYITVWDLAVMRPTAVWQAHAKAMLGIQGWGPDKIITHGRDNKLIVWKLATADEAGLSKALPVEDLPVPRQQPWVLHQLEVNTMNFCSFSACARRTHHDDTCDLGDSPDILVAVPNTLLSEAVDIYSLPSQSRIHTVKPRTQNGMAMCLRLFHHDRCLTLLAAFENGCATVQRLESSGAWITTYRTEAHSQPVLSLDLDPGRAYFLTSSADSMIAKHPIPTALQAVACLPDDDGVVAMDLERRSLLSEAANSSAKVPSPPERREEWKHPLKTVNTKHAGQQSLMIRSDGKIFATAGWDANIRVYSCKTLRELAVLQWHKVGAYAVALASVGTPSAAAASDSGTRPLSCKDSSSTALLGVKDRRIRQATKAHWIAAGAKDGKVSLWDVY
ncbi:hypothetical protein RJ55_05274 [Drechmeria coniospora]|nr:hypothetical protein RJ55_05274 [Drechmeria coniospora]